MNYKQYLQTSTWRARRNAKLRAVDWRCEQCGKKHGLEVHHRTYDRLGAERDEDLAALCSECHKSAHVSQKWNKLGIYYRIIDDLIRERLAPSERFDALADLTEDIKSRCAQLKVPYNSDSIARAMSLMGDDRLGMQASRRAARATTAPPDDRGTFVTHAEACAILRQLGVRVRDLAPEPAARWADRCGDSAPERKLTVYD